MACCKCCCGNKNCDEGEIGKCCCGGPTGTCCEADEYCCDGECEPAPCSGACCDPVFGCTQAADEGTCTEGGGTWLGPGISCDPNPCPGACCDTVFGGCTQESQADCEENGRTFLGVGVPCGENTCECTRDEDCGCEEPSHTYYPGLAAIYPGLGCCPPGSYYEAGHGCWAGEAGTETAATASMRCCAGECQPVVQHSQGTCQSGERECPSGCCPEQTWVCCPEGSANFCASCLEDCNVSSLSYKVKAVEEGPGTELKKLLSKIGITSSPTCSCNARAKTMDEKGISWCEENVETICDWLQEEATKRKLPFVRLAGKALIHMAIRRAKKGTNK